MIIDIEDFIAVKGFKAMGNQLTTDKQTRIFRTLGLRGSFRSQGSG
jgi:hypothetical protein